MPERVLQPVPAPRIGIVVVQYGAAPLGPELSNTLAELLTDGTAGAGVCVVRNPRTPADHGVPAGILGASLVVLANNDGYAVAANRGIAHLIERTGPDVVVVVTPDVVMEPGCVAALADGFAHNSRLGLAGPLLRGTVDGLWHAGGTWSALRGARHRYISDPHGGVAQPQWIDGAVLALRVSAWEETGGFDEGTFLYGEDVALGLAMTRHGWDVRLVPGARAAQASGMVRRPGAHGYLLVRNDLRSARASGGIAAAAVGAVGGMGRAGWEAVKACTDRDGYGRRHHGRQAVGMVAGVVDGLRRRGGRPPGWLLGGTDIDAPSAPTASDAARERIRVLEVITNLDTGGAQVHVRDLVHALEHRFEMRVAMGIDGRIAQELRRHGTTVYQLRFLDRPMHLRADLRAIRELGALLAEVRPDVVHLHSSKAGFLGRIAARRAGVPTVYTVHGWAFRYGPVHERAVSLLLEYLGARVLRGEIVCVSEADADLARRRRIVAPRHLHVVPNALPPQQMQPTGREGGEMRRAGGRLPHIVMVARHFPQKDHSTALMTLSALRDRPWRATFAGDGPLLQEHRDAVAACGLADRIACPGDVEDINGLLGDADVFLLCTHSEGNPLSVQEAVRAGLALVMTDLEQIREAVPAHWPAEFVPPRSVELTAAALARTLTALTAGARVDPAIAAASATEARLRWDESTAALSTILADAARRTDAPGIEGSTGRKGRAGSMRP